MPIESVKEALSERCILQGPDKAKRNRQSQYITKGQDMDIYEQKKQMEE